MSSKYSLLPLLWRFPWVWEWDGMGTVINPHGLLEFYGDF